MARFDGAEGPTSAPPDGLDVTALEAALRAAVTRTAVTVPGSADGRRVARTLGWGRELEVHPLAGDGLSHAAVAAYVAKYTTKDVDEDGRLGRPIRSLRQLDALGLPSHLDALARRAFELGGRVKLPRIDPTTRRLPEPEELAALTEALPAEYRIAVWLGAVLGLRFSEVAGLRIGRLDLAAGRLTVAESVTRGPDGEPSFGPPKSHAGRRTLALSNELCRLLAEHLADRGLSASDADRFVLEAPGGGPVRYENFRTRIWAPTCAAVGLKGLGFHDLRRASAIGLVLEGVDLKTAQTRLGHSDPRLTIGIYAQAISAADHAAAEALATRFLPHRPAPADDPASLEPAASRPVVEPVAAAVQEASVASVTPLSRHRRDSDKSRDMAATWSPSQVLSGWPRRRKNPPLAGNLRVDLIGALSNPTVNTPGGRLLQIWLGNSVPDLPVRLDSGQSPLPPHSSRARKPRQVQHRLASAEAEQLLEQYRVGVPVAELAANYRVNRTTVLAHARRAGLSRNGLKLPADRLDQAAAMYEAGNSLRVIGRTMGVAENTVRSALIARGVGIRPRLGRTPRR